jgi:transposase-like protein
MWHAWGMPTPRARLPFDRPRWTAQDAREVIDALDRSGQAVSVFAAAHGLDPQRLYMWRRRFAAVAEGDPTTFRELTVHASSPRLLFGSEAAAFEIALGSGVVVRVPPSFDAAALARLLDVLAQARAC